MAEGDRRRWNETWSGRGAGLARGSSALELIGDRIPDAGRALDVGGGGSTDSLKLARHGLDVTVVDVSDVGLAAASARAAAEGLTVTTVLADLDVDPLPRGPWDVIVVANFLDRGLLGRLHGLLVPGGLLAIAIATIANLERHERPGPRFLLDRDELPTLLGDLDVVHHSEAWRANGRHEAHVLAEAPSAPRM